MCFIIPKPQNKQAVKTMNARTQKSKTRVDRSQNRQISVLQSKYDATIGLLEAQRQKNNIKRTMLSSTRMLTPKEAMFAPSLINARNGDISQETPLIEKVFRTRLDPAHASRYARGISSSQRTYTHTSKAVFSITAPANFGLWIISLPFLECPFIYSSDGGNNWYGRWGDGFANVWNRVNLAKAEASRTIGKSMTISNSTKPDSLVPLCYSLRLDPCFNLVNKCDSTYLPAIGNTTVAITDGNYAAARTQAANRKVIQNVPRDFTTVSAIATKHKEGVYLVNKILDDDFRKYQVYSELCATNSDRPPAVDDEYSVARLGFLGQVAIDGSAYILNENAWNPAGTNNARLPVSQLMNTDMTAFYSPPNASPQTYTVECYEHTQYMTGDMALITSKQTDEPYAFPDMDTSLKLLNVQLRGDYPPEYNDWGSVWNWVKNKATAVGNFYKKNAKVLKPALSLIPGASTALEMVDQYI